MDQTITIDVIGGFLVTISQGDYFVSTEIGEGALFIKAADSEINSQTLPVVIPPTAHLGKLEIWDSQWRLVYSRRPLPRMLVNNLHGSSKFVPLTLRGRRGSQAVSWSEVKTLISSHRCSCYHSY